MAASETGDCVELLLDLDQGSMTVYKNDERLGVMVASGLSGEYCWAVSHYCGTVLIGGPEEGGRPVDADSGAIFRRFDLDRDGLLDRGEMKAAAAAVCPPPHGSWHDELWDEFCAKWKAADPASGFDLAAFGRFHRFTRVTMPGANAVPEIPLNPFEKPLELKRSWSDFYYDDDSGELDWENAQLYHSINIEAELTASGLMQGEAAEVQQAAAAGWVST